MTWESSYRDWTQDGPMGHRKHVGDASMTAVVLATPDKGDRQKAIASVPSTPFQLDVGEPIVGQCEAAPAWYARGTRSRPRNAPCLLPLGMFPYLVACSAIVPITSPWRRLRALAAATFPASSHLRRCTIAWLRAPHHRRCLSPDVVGPSFDLDALKDLLLLPKLRRHICTSSSQGLVADVGQSQMSQTGALAPTGWPASSWPPLSALSQGFDIEPTNIATARVSFKLLLRRRACRLGTLFMPLRTTRTDLAIKYRRCLVPWPFAAPDPCDVLAELERSDTSAPGRVKSDGSPNPWNMRLRRRGKTHGSDRLLPSYMESYIGNQANGHDTA
ncbi:hypothetical protein C2E23DRAFT_595982 [Lenzites betulinus]|nr:hypothetical protein C2E23DRAFT_595982 [Lenzites betulinus]